jgi:thiamine-phosphate diphosphorylase
MDRKLHLITDPTLEPLAQVARIEAALPHGIDAVHVRLPQATARRVYDLAMVLQASLLQRHIPLIINDRVDVALAVNARGVQLGVRSLPVRAVRQILGPEAPVGASVRSIEGARTAEAEGATWVTFGHVFESPSHPSQQPRGLDTLREVVEAVRIPVIAIGGITRDRVPGVLATGARGIAVISAILQAEDIASASRSLRAALDGTTPRSIA